MNAPECLTLQGYRRGGEKRHRGQESHGQRGGGSRGDWQGGEEDAEAVPLEPGRAGEQGHHQNTGAGIHHVRGAGAQPPQLPEEESPGKRADLGRSHLAPPPSAGLGGQSEGEEGPGEQPVDQRHRNQAKGRRQQQARQIAQGRQTQVIEQHGPHGCLGQRLGIGDQQHQQRLHLAVAVEVEGEEAQGEHHGHQGFEPAQPARQSRDAPRRQRTQRQTQAGEQQRQQDLGRISGGSEADLPGIGQRRGQQDQQVHGEVHEPQKHHPAQQNRTRRDGQGKQQFVVLGVVELGLGKKHRAHQGEDQTEERGQGEVEPGQPQRRKRLADGGEEQIEQHADAEEEIEVDDAHKGDEARGTFFPAGSAQEAPKSQAQQRCQHITHLPFLPAPGTHPPGWRRP